MSKRKGIAAAAVLAVLGVPGTAPAEGDEATWQEKCEVYEGLAETVMKKRQHGAAMSDLMEIAEDDRFLQRMIRMAYEQPRYNSEEYISKTVSEFSNNFYLACAKKLGDR